MVTLEDCLAFTGLTEEEVLAIAEHEHIPEVAAAALGQYLLRQDGGADEIRQLIAEDVRAAFDRGDLDHARSLAMALRHFIQTHPDARQPIQASRI